MEGQGQPDFKRSRFARLNQQSVEQPVVSGKTAGQLAVEEAKKLGDVPRLPEGEKIVKTEKPTGVVVPDGTPTETMKKSYQEARRWHFDLTQGEVDKKTIALKEKEAEKPSPIIDAEPKKEVKFVEENGKEYIDTVAKDMPGTSEPVVQGEEKPEEKKDPLGGRGGFAAGNLGGWRNTDQAGKPVDPKGRVIISEEGSTTKAAKEIDNEKLVRELVDALKRDKEEEATTGKKGNNFLGVVNKAAKLGLVATVFSELADRLNLGEDETESIALMLRKAEERIKKSPRGQPEETTAAKPKRESRETRFKKEIRDLDPRTLQTRILNESDPRKLAWLQAEKQERLNDLVLKYREITGGGDLVSYRRTRLKEVLERSFPNYFRAPLEDYHDNFGHQGLLDDYRHLGLVEIWIEDEVNRLLLDIYDGTKDPAVIASASIPDIGKRRQLEEKDRRSRINMGVDIANPVGILQRVPATRAQWEKLMENWPFSQEVRQSMAAYYNQKEQAEKDGVARRAADAAAAAAAARTGLGETRNGRKVIVIDGFTYIEDEIPDIPKTFSERWLECRGLPKKVAMATAYPDQYIVRDMRYMVHQLMNGHGTQGFDAESIRRGLELEERERAKREGRSPDFTELTDRATEAFNHFMWGDYSVMRLMQAETNQTIRSWVGPDGNSGILNEIKPNMKWIVHQIRRDPNAVSAMRVFIALGGTPDEDYRNIAGMTEEERQIVNRYFDRVKELMKVKEYKKLPNGSIDYDDDVMSRGLGVRVMNEISEELVEMGLDRGSVQMVREVCDLIAWSPETVDPRKQYVTFEKYLKGDTKASVSLIGRTTYPGGPTFAQGLSTIGMESLFDNIESWTHAPGWLVTVYSALPELFKTLQTFDDYVEGKDEFSIQEQRRQAANDLIDKIMLHKEFPPVDSETATRLRKWKFYEKAGETVKIKRGDIIDQTLRRQDEAFRYMGFPMKQIWGGFRAIINRYRGGGN